jgi:DNA polymerase-3 subunit gamma/tau
MTLYLKYRPQTIDELDLESVRKRLKSLLFNNTDIPHAFLFAGPKGTGKTSAARILAKVINCENNKKRSEPCNKCSQCISISKGTNIDVVELDAASNRGIDDIRSLKESVALSPNSAKKKIYIIDEAHMLTLEAANAFLKTLEEPPPHVIFILATTDPQRLPQTILSRLTTIQFHKANAKEIARQLDRVINGEKLKIENGVIDLIISHSDGSFRDAVKLLESM